MGSWGRGRPLAAAALLEFSSELRKLVFSGETCLSITNSLARGSWSVVVSTAPGLLWLCLPVAVSFQWAVAHLFQLSDVFSISPVEP